MEQGRDIRNLNKTNKSDFCGTKLLFEMFSNVQQLRSKLTNHLNVFACHNNISETYKCKNCDYATSLKLSLTHHFNLIHQRGPRNQNQYKKVERRCGYCNFQSYSTLHFLKHCFKCDKREDLGRYGTFYKNINWLECVQCPYKTRNKYYLRSHLKHQHSPNSRFQCEKCPFETRLQSYLRRHVSLHHKDLKNIDKWFKCETCPYKTKFTSNLKRHIKSNHLDSPDSLKSLQAHELVESNFDEPDSFQCPKCEFQTKWKTSLKRHIANTHTESANVECKKDKSISVSSTKFLNIS